MAEGIFWLAIFGPNLFCPLNEFIIQFYQSILSKETDHRGGHCPPPLPQNSGYRPLPSFKMQKDKPGGTQPSMVAAKMGSGHI